MPYFQDLQPNELSIPSLNYPLAKIQKDDLLGIYINSEGGDAQTLFGTLASESGTSISTNSGFLVTESGEVQLATIGKVKLSGLTTIQAEEEILSKARIYVVKPKVVVRILNFKVSITGDVSKAGIYTIATGKVNVMEALALAGDLNLTAKRDRILVMRHDEDGTMHLGRIDMRSKNVFESPYFYLKNNDMIYVEPDLRRLNRDQNIYRNIGVVASVLATLSLILLRGSSIF